MTSVWGSKWTDWSALRKEFTPLSLDRRELVPLLIWVSCPGSPLSTEDHPGGIKQLSNEPLAGSLLWAHKHPWEGIHVLGHTRECARIRKTDWVDTSSGVQTHTCAPRNVIQEGFACLQIIIISSAVYVLQHFPPCLSQCLFQQNMEM